MGRVGREPRHSGESEEVVETRRERTDQRQQRRGRVFEDLALVVLEEDTIRERHSPDQDFKNVAGCEEGPGANATILREGDKV